MLFAGGGIGGNNDYVNEEAAHKAALLEALPVGQFHKFPQVGWIFSRQNAESKGRTVVTKNDIEALPAVAYSFAGQNAPVPANAVSEARIIQDQAKSRIASLLGDKVAQLLIDSGIITFTNKGNAYQGVTFSNGKIALNLDALTADNFDGVLLHEGFHSTIKELAAIA